MRGCQWISAGCVDGVCLLYVGTGGYSGHGEVLIQLAWMYLEINLVMSTIIAWYS